MSTIISQLRSHFKPDTVKVLFLAESPPESNDDEVRFFYNPRQERWDHMYRSVMKAVFPDFEYRPGQKDQWLSKFMQYGYYLIDAIDFPINRLLSDERRRLLNVSIKGKLSEIATLVTQDTPIVLVKRNVFLAFNDPLRKAGYNVIHESFLPFPAYGHQEEFIAACAGCLRNLQRGNGTDFHMDIQ